MKTIYCIIIGIAIVSIYFLSSCSSSKDIAYYDFIQKREYSKGYFVNLPDSYISKERRQFKIYTTNYTNQENTIKNADHVSENKPEIIHTEILANNNGNTLKTADTVLGNDTEINQEYFASIEKNIPILQMKKQFEQAKNKKMSVFKTALALYKMSKDIKKSNIKESPIPDNIKQPKFKIPLKLAVFMAILGLISVTIGLSMLLLNPSFLGYLFSFLAIPLTFFPLFSDRKGKDPANAANVIILTSAIIGLTGGGLILLSVLPSPLGAIIFFGGLIVVLAYFVYDSYIKKKK